MRAARTELQSQQRRASATLQVQLQQRREALGALSAQLELLNPQRTLERGYAIVQDAHGKVLRSPGQIPVPGVLSVRLPEGSAQVGVATVQTEL